MRLPQCLFIAGLLSLLSAGCQDGVEKSTNASPQRLDKSGKADTAYYNPDGLEVEVDLEGDIEGPDKLLLDGPAELGQYALTYLRKTGLVFLESLAEDVSSRDRIEWQLDGRWLLAREVVKMKDASLKHFRIRGVNAVLLQEASVGVEEGKVLIAKLPLNPFEMMGKYGASCADDTTSHGLDQSIYWYLWEPDKTGCQAEIQEMKVTVSKVLPKAKPVYPEYDRLIEDGKITVVMMFGQTGDGELKENDDGLYWTNWTIDNALQSGFQEVIPAPVGRRFSKQLNSITVELDIYSPREFAGLGDMANFDNFQRAISEHEIVAYSGHSMLGASDFWSKPEYPSSYQIFLYGGCLGYQYYLRPILAGKKGWDNLDLVTSVVEVPIVYNDWPSLVTMKIISAVENDYRVSWTDIIDVVRQNIGQPTFGVSGVRDNVFQP